MPRRVPWGAWLALAGFVGLGVLASAAGAAVTGLPNRGGWLPMRLPGPLPGVLLPGVLLLGADALPGVAAWLVWRRLDVGLHRKRAALRLWGWGLPARAAWAAAAVLPVPWAVPWHGWAQAAALLLLGGLTLFTIRAFWPLQRFAAAMLLPYMACIGAAGWLGASV